MNNVLAVVIRVGTLTTTSALPCFYNCNCNARATPDLYIFLPAERKVQLVQNHAFTDRKSLILIFAKSRFIQDRKFLLRNFVIMTHQHVNIFPVSAENRDKQRGDSRNF